MFPAPRAAYIHIPFCRHRCGYCNFTVIANRDDLQADYLSALELEITQSLRAPRSLDTLFIGGGTPTALSVEHLRQLCDMLRQWFSLEDRYEWTIEANPADLDLAKLEVLSAAGVNRISLGAQSFQSAKLQRLERDHCGADVEHCVREARSRFDSVALDLIFAVPGESVADWQTDLDQAMRLQPDHLSVYGLTIEKGTVFWNRAARGDLIPIGEEQQRAMYELARTVLVEAGWEHYEVSNYARPGHHCRHNTTYWVGDPYFAFGAGAARYVDGWRETNHRSTRNYLQRMMNGQVARRRT
jgi:oxygen-independent coproporphyrinogen-3 oxidase